MPVDVSDREIVPHVETDRTWWNRLIHLSVNRRAGFRLFAATSIGLTVLAVLVAGPAQWITEIDVGVEEELVELRSSSINEAMVWVTRLGSRWVIGSLLVALTIWVVRTGRCRKALMVMVIAFLANPILEFLLKAIVGRERPTQYQLVAGNGPAFPSGHVLATVGFYGVLAAVVWRSSDRRRLRVGAYAAATVIIIAVGFSRVYLGVHWFTDVVGGMLAGTAFVLGVASSLRGHHLGGGIGCEVRDPAAQPVASATSALRADCRSR